mgnify:CR=1 FL=1
MNRKLAWGTAFVAAVLVGAFVLLRPRYLLSDDTRPEERASELTERVIEIESLKKDLEFVAGLSKLGLNAEQTGALLDAARKADELKREFMSQRAGDLDQAIDVMKELRGAINRGEPHEEIQEEADLLKRRFERFQKKFNGEMDAIVDGVMETLKDVQGPEASGDLLQTVDAVTKIEQALDDIRYMTEEEYTAKIDQGIDQHLDKTGIHEDEERATEHARLREIADKARTMATEEYESHVHDLAEEILMKGATGERLSGAKQKQGKDVRGKVKEVLLRDSTIEILEERLEALRAK